MLWRAGGLIFVLKHGPEIPHAARHLGLLSNGPVDTSFCAERIQELGGLQTCLRQPLKKAACVDGFAVKQVNIEDIDCQKDVPGLALRYRKDNREFIVSTCANADQEMNKDNAKRTLS
jgi:hypothetical protein